MAEIVVSDKVDISQATTTKCKGCWRKIRKGLPRVQRSWTHPRYGTMNGYLCHKCYEDGLKKELELLEYHIIRTKELKEEMRKMVETKQKEILAEEIVESLKDKEERN